MRRLAGRVARLERAHGAALSGECRVCGGAGRPGIAFEFPGEPRREPPGCPGCGKSRAIKVIIIEADPPDGGRGAV